MGHRIGVHWSMNKILAGHGGNRGRTSSASRGHMLFWPVMSVPYHFPYADEHTILSRAFHSGLMHCESRLLRFSQQRKAGLSFLDLLECCILAMVLKHGKRLSLRPGGLLQSSRPALMGYKGKEVRYE